MKIYSKASRLNGAISIPGSKSHTIRAIAIATMAEGKSVLRGALDSEDTRSAIKAATVFGAKVDIAGDIITIEGIGNNPVPEGAFIDVGNSGTTLRIFTALAALYNTEVKFDGDKSIRQRPMTPLFSALTNLGAKINSTDEKCPFTICGPLKGGKTTVNGISSQFVTALLFTAPLIKGETEILVENLHEQSYVSITLDWLTKQQITFQQKGFKRFKVPGNQKYSAFDNHIAADFSSATFALCAAAVTKSQIKIQGLDFKDHQGDKKVFDYLKEMGMDIIRLNDGVNVRGRELHGIDIDMNDTPDALPAMAVISCFAEGETRLLNVAQARLKECDRINAIATELKKMGADISELPDGLVIRKSNLKGTLVHGYDDHRMVMSLALAGLNAEGETIIDTAESIKITYPTFVEDMVAIGANMQILGK
ncbi:MAG: 3-phosphoshikimate 1-carboxyvinyltransferase [Bacteroidales bacterium]|nr:3-phosphoshikimate 1-carboxyvinyltransferase [Bacteroidales bacterium]MBN2818143.1 3-phosphoshikimate 1-carboxyvinyltransferase [Bacteroidales bacterium]